MDASEPQPRSGWKRASSRLCQAGPGPVKQPTWDQFHIIINIARTFQTFYFVVEGLLESNGKGTLVKGPTTSWHGCCIQSMTTRRHQMVCRGRWTDGSESD